MELSAVLTMFIVLGIVWGGFFFFLSRAFKYEKLKLKDGKD